MAPPIFLILPLAVIFGIISSIFMIVAVSTDQWEITKYSSSKLQTLENILLNESYLDDTNGFYKVVRSEFVSGNLTKKTYYLRDLYGGIWRVCDTVSETFKQENMWLTAKENAQFLKYDCFDYIQEFEKRRDENLLDENGMFLIRMQNSASSCNIVSLMCLLIAAITGTFGILQKQVTACMVTGVMYIVAGVFVCFALIIMHTKVNYLKTECYTMDPLGYPGKASVTEGHWICDVRSASSGWSMPVAWVAFAFLILAFMFWLLLVRCIRLEKAKSIL